MVWELHWYCRTRHNCPCPGTWHHHCPGRKNVWRRHWSGSVAINYQSAIGRRGHGTPACYCVQVDRVRYAYWLLIGRKLLKLGHIVAD
jgi:hypothetical protein